MRVFFLMMMFMLIPGLSHGAGFEDPWAKGSGFDDPWAKKGLETPAENKKDVQSPKTEKGKKTSGETRKSSPSPVSPPPIEKRPAMPMPPKDGFSTPKPGDIKTREKVKDNEKSGESRESAKVSRIKKEAASRIPRPLSPLNHTAGMPMLQARAMLQSMGLKEGGKCGNGTVYFIDPVNACVAIGVRGGARGLEGAATWVSKKCLEANPAAYMIYAGFASKGEEKGGGWENNINFPGFQECVRRSAVAGIGDLPRFLGVIHPFMPKDFLEGELLDIGAKPVKKYKNGMQYQYGGASIFYEYCPNDGKMISLGLRVDKEDPKLMKELDDMGMAFSSMRFGDILYRIERKDGRIDKLQWTNSKASSECGRGGV